MTIICDIFVEGAFGGGGGGQLGPSKKVTDTHLDDLVLVYDQVAAITATCSLANMEDAAVNRVR